jgi:high affinity Mn2+ porin
VGSHGGYAAGRSNWSATQAGAAAPTLSGTLDLFNLFDAFKGTGSYFLGLQAGYNYVFPSRLLLGIEADVSFPSLISGTSLLSAGLIGQASYQELVQFSGTARGRFGFTFDRWLIYGTAGFAWTFDQFMRTRLAGMPVGGLRRPAMWRRCLSCHGSAEPSAAASNLPSRRTGRLASNTSTRLTLRAA